MADVRLARHGGKGTFAKPAMVHNRPFVTARFNGQRTKSWTIQKHRRARRLLYGVFSAPLERSEFEWDMCTLSFAVYKRRPNHDHFRAHLAGPHVSFLGYPRMPHQMHLLHTKIFHLMCRQMPF